jgi:uncharacterized protein YkwD
VKPLSLRQLGCFLVLCGSLSASVSRADPVSAVQLLRVSGCGGIMPAIQPLHPDRQLNRAAVLWANGGAPLTAAAHSGYPAQAVVGLRLRGPDDAILQSLRRARCRPVADQTLRDVGVYREGRETWVLMASAQAGVAPVPAAAEATEAPARAFPYSPPSAAPDVSRTTSRSTSRATSTARVLQLVNEVRANGTSCGEKSFGPAPPLQMSGTLDSVASEHAVDMARHDYFEHVDLNGHTPADRVRATGYRERLVGENIAYGPTSADEVVQGWLHSTGHCENIMDPRFVEMGLAAVPGQGSRRGLYWDQLLTEPAP